MKRIVLLITAIMVVSSLAIADTAKDDKDGALFSDIFGDRLNIEGRLRGDMFFAEDGEDKLQPNARLKAFDIFVTAKLAKNIKAVIRMRLDRVLVKNGESVADEFDVEKFLHDAYISIKNVGGLPIAFIIGKHEMAFGQDFTKMPIYHNSLLHSDVEYKEVFGLTMVLDKNIFNLFDKAEISIFETGKKDLDIGTFDGVSIRLTKQLTKKIKAKLSYIHIGNGDNDDQDSEDRGSIGVVYKSGAWTAWSEGALFFGHKKYGDAFAITAGVSRNLGPGRVAVEGSYIQDSIMQLGFGYDLFLTRNSTFGAEVRYRIYDDEFSGEDNETIFAMRMTYYFGTPKKFNKHYLFGKDED